MNISYPDVCPSCGIPYEESAIFCSNSFHLCRDCVRFNGRAVQLCTTCKEKKIKLMITGK